MQPRDRACRVQDAEAGVEDVLRGKEFGGFGNGDRVWETLADVYVQPRVLAILLRLQRLAQDYEFLLVQAREEPRDWERSIEPTHSSIPFH